LTRPFDKHLDGDELDRLLSLQRTSVSDSGRLLGQSLREAERHVQSCPDCSRKLQMHKSVHSEILLMRAPKPQPLTQECIGDAGWLDVAAGLCPDAKTIELLKHAAQCGHCGPLLKSASEALVDETTPGEEAWLASLRSARPEWRENLAAILLAGAGAKNDSREKQEGVQWWQALFSWQRPAFALSAIAAAILAGWLGSRMLRPPSAEQLLAQAYTEHRTLEVRISGAKYAPMRVERAASGSSLDKSPALLKAEALIGENLRQNPNDPRWLQAKARADLLDGNYESAIKSLQRALGTKPDDPTLLTDLGSAYFARAETTNRAIDYGNSIESLGKALTNSPDDPVALFNRALACERMFLYTQAIDDWEHYLRVDPQSEWSDDVRQRLSALQGKIKQHEKGQAEPLVTPKEFVAALASSEIEALSELDSRPEEYLDEAIKQWLPSVFSANHESSETVRMALGSLAEVLVTRHQDTWLKDLLRTPASTGFSTGLHYLSNAAQANAQGDPDAALLNARLAERWFLKIGSQPARLRAQLEEVFALHRQYHGADCLADIANMEGQLRSESYPWIETQSALEHYACLGAEETQLDSAKQLIASARANALRTKYEALYLRALGFSASSESESGSTEKAWEWNRVGLGRYWSGHYPPLRAQHFYDDLTISAQDAGEWFLALVLGREAVSAVAASPNRTGEGMERIRLAGSAIHERLWQEAGQQYAEALKAFSSLPEDKSTRAFRATAEVGLGNLALSHNQTREAEAHLRYARANLPPDFEDDQTWLSLYRAWAELRRQVGDPEGAKKACTAAILVAEVALRGIHSELERLRWNRTGADCFKKLVSSRLSDHDEISALELWEWYQSARTGVPRSNALPTLRFADFDRSSFLPPIEDIRSQLSLLNRETVIAYAELDDQVGAWIYDDRGIFWQHLEVTPASLKSAAAKFEAECGDSQSDIAVLRKDGRRLYDSLFVPLKSRLDPFRVLVIEAMDDIAAIPFAALVNPSGTYLIDELSLAYLPSGGYRRLLRDSLPINRQDAALVIGAPALSPKDRTFYLPLADAEQEAENVATEFTHAVRLSGNEATASALTKLLPDVAIFHFAGHTQSQPGHSGLLLAPESDAADRASSVLSADELATLTLPRLRLAVLSACTTSRVLTYAEESESLAQAFLLNGVPSVIATRWRVDSAATAAFMRVFYESMLNGEEAPAAVAGSMKHIRALPQYSHPYYWAAFDAFGRASRSLGM
jgi:CHAT domain-containing protein